MKRKQNFIFELLIIFIVFAMINVVYYFEMKAEALELCKNHLSSKHIEVNRYIENHIKDIKEYSKIIGTHEEISSNEALKILKSISEESKFYHLQIGDENGQIYKDENEDNFIMDMEYYKEAFSGETGYFKSKVDNGEEVITVYTPILSNEEKIKGVLLASFAKMDIAKDIEKEFLKDGEYVELFNSNGDIVLKTPNSKSQYSSYSEFFMMDSIYDNYSLDSIYDDIKSKSKGYITYDSENDNRYTYYGPLNGIEMYTFLTISTSEFERYFAKIKDISMIMTMLVSIGFYIMLIFFMKYSKKYNRGLIKANEKLRLANEKFLVVISDNKKLMFEYDVKNNTFTHFGDGFNIFGVENNSTMDAKFLLERRILDDEYYHQYMECINKIKEGEKEVKQILKVSKKDGGILWLKIELKSLFNDKGEVVSAVGTLEDISENKQLEFDYLKMEEENKLRLKDVTKAFLINVTEEKIRFLNPIEKKEHEDGNYYNIIEKDVLLKVHKDDYNTLFKLLDPSNIKKEFINGNSSLSLDYREVENDNKISWSNVNINLIIDPENKDLTGYVYMKEITREKEEELSLIHKAKRDMLTGIYNRYTTEIMVNDVLFHGKANEIHAFAILDLDSFKIINDTCGHMVGDNLLISITKKVSEVLHERDIFGRLGGDEFIIFLRDVGEYMEIHRKITKIMDKLREIRLAEKPDYEVTVSIGIALSKSKENSYVDLYKKADDELYKVKNNGKNNYKIFDKDSISIFGVTPK